MSWMSALSGWQWFLLLLVPPLILMLYFLKLRRTPLEVPSTYLWTRTIEDLHVNSIWQKLRNSLLLLLQLLVCLFLMLALLRPGCDGDELQGEYFIFLVDNSASMATTDVEAGTRLKLAKEKVDAMISRMEADDKGMLISFSDSSRILQSYTSNKSQLRKRLQDIKQSQRATNIKEALVASSALANPGRTSTEAGDVQVADAIEAQLHVFTDGGFPNVQEIGLGNLQAQYHPIGGLETPDNIGISAFSVSSDVNLTGKMQAFAQLINTSDAGNTDDAGNEKKSTTVSISLYVNDELADADATVTVRAEDKHELSFDLTAIVADLEEAAEVRLEIDDPDSYMLDNVAYAVINPPRPANVLVVTDQNPFLSDVMDTDRVRKVANVTFESRFFLDEKDYQDQADLGFYDLVIYDQCAPKSMPACSTLFFNSVPRESDWKIGEPQFPTVIMDVNTTHPVMADVGFNRVRIAQSAEVTAPKGSLKLVEATYGSIMSIGTRGGYEDLIVGFPLVEYGEDGSLLNNTDWGRFFSFPLFMQHVLESMGGGSRFQALKSSRPGELVTVRTPVPLEEVRIEGPDKIGGIVKQSREGDYVFSQAELPGMYKVVDPEAGDTIKMFAVNLLDVNESRLKVRDELEIGHELVEGTRSKIKVRREYWTWLAIVAIVFLMIEWVIYNRRVLV